MLSFVIRITKLDIVMYVTAFLDENAIRSYATKEWAFSNVENGSKQLRFGGLG